MVEFAQLENMRLGVDYKAPVQLRGFTLTLRPLSVAETIQICSEVNQEWLKLPEFARTGIMQNTLMAQKTLVKASTPSPDIYSPQITEMVLQNMTPDEIIFLYNEYRIICERVNPSLEELPRDKLDELVEEIKKNKFTRDRLIFFAIGESCPPFIKQS
ncbi:MAG: hypothetical protein HC842_07125, partial [Cytophagales bacterium]|nr:hypothetical protein [Cytophagales bacterium]